MTVSLVIVCVHAGGVRNMFMWYVHVATSSSVFAVLLETLDGAIEDCHQGNVTPHVDAHNRVKQLYTWQDVARRTEKVGCIVCTFAHYGSG